MRRCFDGEQLEFGTPPQPTMHFDISHAKTDLVSSARQLFCGWEMVPGRKRLDFGI
jgi:hypothetical protein